MPGLPAGWRADLGQGHITKKDIPMLFSSVKNLFSIAANKGV